jgi:hypothetical protein
VLDDPTSPQPSFDVDAAGEYIISLVVTDVNGNPSVADRVIVSTENSPPVANAGVDQTVHAGATVTLDGTGSYDPDSDEITYSWSLDAKPAESQAVLDDPAVPNPTFMVDKVGAYQVSLVVFDSNGSPSAPDEVIISTENSAPIANAGIDQTVDVGALVTLDGSSSSDPDGDSITYAWSVVSVPAGSSASLSDPTALKPTFLADTPGDYVIRLVVYDIHGAASSADAVSVSTINSAPTADAGDDQTIHVGVLATLIGSGSDPNSDEITFSWQFTAKPAGSAATLANPDTAAPSFTPDVAGDYSLALVVTDIWGLPSSPDYVTVSTTNTRPVASAGADIAVTLIGTAVNLDGSQSYDDDGDNLSFSWTIRTAPSGNAATLDDAAIATPSFVPDVYGDYVIELIVSDTWSQSDPDEVVVSFANIKPVADAGNSQSVQVGDQVQLDGSGSTDANGDPLTFSWTLSRPAGSTTYLDDPSSVMPSFTVDVAGIYTASLVVNDGYENSDPSSVTIEAAQSTGDLVTKLQVAIAAINGIDDACFKNKNMKKTLVNKLNAVLSKIDEGLYAEAYNKLLHDVLGKMDGCGSSPDNNDWIQCCNEQQMVRSLIEDAMEILASMI